MEFRRCQPPCARFIAREDPDSKCIKCLGFSHARDAVYGISKCKICDDFRLITLRSRLEDCERKSSIFPWHASSTSAAPFGPALADALPPSGQEARPSAAYSELVDVLSRATEKLALDWPDEPRESRASKLDKWFLIGAHSKPERRKLPFFSDLHREISSPVFLMDAPISQSGLFGEAVSAVVDKFRSAKTQSAALKQFMPRRARDYSTPSSSVSREQSLPRKEPPSGGAQATRPPPTTVWGARGRYSSRQQPRKRVNLKRPNKPAASANPGCS